MEVCGFLKSLIGSGFLKGLICVGSYQPLNRLQSVGLIWFLVRSQAENSGESKGIPALVPFGFLDSVKRDLNDDAGFDQPNSPVGKFLNCVQCKPLGHLR